MASRTVPRMAFARTQGPEFRPILPELEKWRDYLYGQERWTCDGGPNEGCRSTPTRVERLETRARRRENRDNIRGAMDLASDRRVPVIVGGQPIVLRETDRTAAQTMVFETFGNDRPLQLIREFARRPGDREMELRDACVLCAMRKSGDGRGPPRGGHFMRRRRRVST